jgi:hypothetical protein
MLALDLKWTTQAPSAGCGELHLADAQLPKAGIKLTQVQKSVLASQMLVLPTSEISSTGLDADPVVNRVSKMLLAAEVSFGRLHGGVAQQKLDLVQFPSGIAA